MAIGGGEVEGARYSIELLVERHFRFEVADLKRGSLSGRTSCCEPYREMIAEAMSRGVSAIRLGRAIGTDLFLVLTSEKVERHSRCRI